MKTFKGLLKELPDNGIYVFFSNIHSRYDRGPAKIAKELFGAREDRPPFTSHGRTFAICVEFNDPAKDMKFLYTQIDTFYRIVNRDSDKLFYVMCHDKFNFHNYTIEDMIKAFKSKLIPNNIVWEESFYDVMQGKPVRPVQPRIINDEI